MFSFCVNVINYPPTLYRMPAPCAVLMSKPRCSGNGGGRQLHRQVQPQERRKELARSYPSVGKGRPLHTIVHKKVSFAFVLMCFYLQLMLLIAFSCRWPCYLSIWFCPCNIILRSFLGSLRKSIFGSWKISLNWRNYFSFILFNISSPNATFKSWKDWISSVIVNPTINHEL